MPNHPLVAWYNRNKASSNKILVKNRCQKYIEFIKNSQTHECLDLIHLWIQRNIRDIIGVGDATILWKKTEHIILVNDL